MEKMEENLGEKSFKKRLKAFLLAFLDDIYTVLPAFNLILTIVQVPIIKDEDLIRGELIVNSICLFILFFKLLSKFRVGYGKKIKQGHIESWIKSDLKACINRIYTILITLTTFILKLKKNVKCLSLLFIKSKDENMFEPLLTYLKTRDGLFVILICMLTIVVLYFRRFLNKMIENGICDYSSLLKNLRGIIFIFNIYILFLIYVATDYGFWIELIEKVMILFVLFSIVNKLFSIICYKCSVSHVWKLIVCMIQKGKITSEVKVEPKVQDKSKNKRTEATEEPKAKEYKVQPAAKSPIGIKRFKRIQGPIRTGHPRRAKGSIRISRHRKSSKPSQIEKSSKL